MSPKRAFRFQKENSVSQTFQLSLDPSVGISSGNRFISLDLLRVIMTILVVGNHAPSYQYFVDVSPVFDYIRALAVPVFVILSAYLSPGVIGASPSSSGVLSRLRRLYTPAVIWGLFYFAADYAVSRFGSLIKTSGSSFQHYPVSMSNIIYQLVFGATVNPALYYLIDVVWLNVLFYLLCVVLFRKRYQTVLFVSLAGIGLFFEYSGLNWIAFSNLDYRMKFTLGRFCEFLPFFSLGLLTRKYSCWFRNWNRTLMATSAGVSLVIGYIIWTWHQPNTFGYGGLGILIGAACLFLTFSKMSFTEETVFAGIVRGLSGVALGVYCIHNLLIPLCGLVFRRYGLASHASMPALFMTIVVLSFLICLVLKSLLGERAKGVVA